MRSVPSSRNRRRTTIGSSTKQNSPSTVSPIAICSAISAPLPDPDCVPATTARITSAIVSVSTVAPTVLATIGSFASLASRISG